MRLIAALLMVFLASCGGAAQSADSSADTSSVAGPSVNVPSDEPVPSATALRSASPLPSESTGLAQPGAGMTAYPLGSLDGQPMGFVEYVPPDTGEGSPPLLVFLHGAGEAGDGSAETLPLVNTLGIPYLIAAGKQEEGTREPWPGADRFLVLMPQYGTGPASGRCGIGDDIDAFLDWAIDVYDADPTRVYLTGISCGAIGIWDYLASYGDEVVAAAVPIAGHALWALEKAGCAPLAEVPVWAFHGAADEVVPVDFVADQIEQIRVCEGVEPAEMEFTVLPDLGHVGSIHPVYDGSAGHDIYAWLLEHSNAGD